MALDLRSDPDSERSPWIINPTRPRKAHRLSSFRGLSAFNAVRAVRSSSLGRRPSWIPRPNAGSLALASARRFLPAKRGSEGTVSEESDLRQLLDLVRRNGGRALPFPRAGPLRAALEAEERLRGYLLRTGQEKVTEANLVAILGASELPDALEAPSVRALVTRLRTWVYWPSSFELYLTDSEDRKAVEKGQREREALLRAVGAAVGHVPRGKRRLDRLEALERIKELVRVERELVRADREAARRRSVGARRGLGKRKADLSPLEEARNRVAGRYGFPSGNAFLDALKDARKKRGDFEA